MSTLQPAVPEDFDYNAQTGRRGDKSLRMEVKRSSVEYIASSEYMVYETLAQLSLTLYTHIHLNAHNLCLPSLVTGYYILLWALAICLY